MTIKFGIKQKIIILTLIAIFFTLSLGYFVIFPTVKDMQDIRNRIIVEKEDLEFKYKKGQHLKKVMEEYNSIKPHREKISMVFVKKGSEIDFITQIISEFEKISGQYHLEPKIQNINTNEEGPEESLTLKIQLTGDFIDMLHFINEIEKLDFYFNISEIDALTSSDDGAIKMKIIGKIFFNSYESSHKI